jgi:hypothetical protein
MADGPVKKFIASYRIGDFPRAGLKLLPWKVAPCDGVLINAYDFLKNRRTLRTAHDLLSQDEPLASLDLPGELILDSGAYYFVRSETADIDPAQIVELAIRLKVPHVVTLDHPFPPGLSEDETLKRIATTADNTKKMDSFLSSKGVPGLSLVPALHGHNSAVLKESFRAQPAIMKADVKIVGVGSLALLAQKGAMREASEAILQARALLAGKHMHVFSVGSPLVMHFAFLCGADSVDSQSWMMSAAFKQAHLPGLVQTRLSIRERERDALMYEKRRNLFELQLLKLHREENFVVKDWITGERLSLRDERDAQLYTDQLEDGRQGNRVHWRACHNLSVGTFEARRFTYELQMGSATDFLLSRHKNGPYWKALNEVLEKLNGTNLFGKE